MEETSVIEGWEKVLIKTDMLELFVGSQRGRDLRIKGKCKKAVTETVQLQKRFPKKPPSSIRPGHDIPTASRLYHASSDRQQETYVWKKRRTMIFMARSTKEL